MRQGFLQTSVHLGAGEVPDEEAYAWARAAGAAAGRVPAADFAERGDWTLRGWAEVALGCAALGVPGGWSGLDDAVDAAGIAVRGVFGRRLAELRALGGRPPDCYTVRTGAEPWRGARELSVDAARACAIVAEFCDALPMDAGPPGGLACGDVEADMSGLILWGESRRPRRDPLRRDPWRVLPTRVDPRLAWRCWMRLPDGGQAGQVTLIETALPLRQDACRMSGSAMLRRRVCHGIHNGAHLDHLGALSANGARFVGYSDAGVHSPLEFGAGLLAAESYAMAVEILAAAECAAWGRPAEARQLGLGLIERIGRVPGYPGWRRQASKDGLLPLGGRSALAGAAAVRVGEFADLPSLASNYLTGPLRFIAGAADPAYFPGDLTDAFRARWDGVARRFPAAARLSERARFLRNSEASSAFASG